MIDLVTLQQAKDHQYLDGTYRDSDVQAKVTAASAIVMNHVKLAAPPEHWRNGSSPETYDIPADIQAATLLVFGDLFEYREATNANPISPAVEALLSHYRDPSMA